MADVKREIRMPLSSAEKLKRLAEQWGARGTGEVITMLLAMYEDERPKPRKRS